MAKWSGAPDLFAYVGVFRLQVGAGCFKRVGKPITPNRYLKRGAGEVGLTLPAPLWAVSALCDLMRCADPSCHVIAAGGGQINRLGRSSLCAHRDGVNFHTALIDHHDRHIQNDDQADIRNPPMFVQQIGDEAGRCTH